MFPDKAFPKSWNRRSVTDFFTIKIRFESPIRTKFHIRWITINAIIKNSGGKPPNGTNLSHVSTWIVCNRNDYFTRSILFIDIDLHLQQLYNLLFPPSLRSSCNITCQFSISTSEKFCMVLGHFKKIAGGYCCTQVALTRRKEWIVCLVWIVKLLAVMADEGVFEQFHLIFCTSFSWNINNGCLIRFGKFWESLSSYFSTKWIQI